MNRVDIKKITMLLNTARLEAGDTIFTLKTFREYVKAHGVKVGNSSLSEKLYKAMCNKGKFINSPIHMDKVKAIYKQISDNARKYQTKMKEDNNQEKDLVLAAIELLKSKGYKILKPVVQYEEV